MPASSGTVARLSVEATEDGLAAVVGVAAS
jgi:hypothetical protein